MSAFLSHSNDSTYSKDFKHRESNAYIELADSANRCIEREEWRQAREVLLTALRLEPANAGNAMLLSNLGVVRSQLQDYTGALEAFDIAIAMAPKSKSVRINKVRTLLTSHQDDEAIEELANILSLDSLQEWSLRTRGLLLLSRKEYARGFADIERYRNHYHADAELLTAGATALAAQGRNKEAIDWYGLSIAEHQSPEAWFSRTLLKIEENQLGEADDDVRRAIAIFPDYGDLYLLRAMLKRKNHLLTESDEDRAIAIRKGASRELADYLLK